MISLNVHLFLGTKFKGKKMNFFNYFFALFLFILSSCTSPSKILKSVNTRFPDNPGKVDRLAKGVFWMSWLGKDTVLNRMESINALVINLDVAPISYDFSWFNNQRRTLSYVADSTLAIAAVNSGYFEWLEDGGYVTFHKSKGEINQEVTIPNNHIRFWKHQSAFIQNGENNFSIIQGNQDLYRNLSSENIISGAPLLISDGVPVGKYFVKQKEGDKSHLPGEHPERHQAGYGPRMAFATTPNRRLILLSVDGRSPLAQGINAEELTDLLYDHFKANNAINMDGGGSLTMFVRGATPNGVVNYPSDQRKINPDGFDHIGQRKIGMGLLLIPKSESLRKKMEKKRVVIDSLAIDYIDNPK